MIDIEHPILSVVIPIYNVEDYLDKCLESIIIDDARVEYLLIDDGSTDGSKLIAKEFLKKVHNAYYFFQENSGVATARNKGLKNAKGKWIFFVDSDDHTSQDFVKNMLKLLPSLSSSDLLTLPIKKMIGNREFILQDGMDSLSIDDFSTEIVRGKKQLGVWAYVFNTEILRKYKLFFKDGILFEDQYFVPKYLNHVKTIKQVSGLRTGYYYYCFRKTSFTNSDLNYNKIIAKFIAESSRNKILLQIGKTKKTINIINENYIDIYFRAYVDMLKINRIDKAKEKRTSANEIIKKIRSCPRFKTIVKIVLLNLPLPIFMGILKLKK